MCTITDLSDLDHTLAADYLRQFTYPWEALKGIKELILSLGPTLGDEYEEVQEHVWVHKTATFFPSAYLVLGGEQSGHIIFGKYATTGDGILTSLMVMMTMLDKKMPRSMLADEMKMYPQCLKNVRVKSKPDAQNDPDVQAAVKAAADALGESVGETLVPRTNVGALPST